VPQFPPRPDAVPSLGAGADDIVDYKQETGLVLVSVDATAGDNDLIWVDNRIDSATSVSDAGATMAK
jgi:hypothetical protein